MQIKGKNLIAGLGMREARELGIKEGLIYEISRLEDGTITLAEKGLDPEEKIMKMLKQKPLSERVEGRFEKLLNKEELMELNNLLEKGKVIKFKLSDKYKKPVYEITEMRMGKKAEKQAGKREIQEGNGFNGFKVLSNEEDAKEFSFEYERELKSGRIIGIKSFDGAYYAIERGLFNSTSGKITEKLKEKTMTLSELAESLKLKEELLKGVCEVLKEEGEITEKKKNLFELV